MSVGLLKLWHPVSQCPTNRPIIAAIADQYHDNCKSYKVGFAAYTHSMFTYGEQYYDN